MDFRETSMSRSLACLLALSLSLTALPVQLHAQALPTLPQTITQVRALEGITEYTLDNGLRVLLFPDSSKSTVTINITYLVGSRHEGYGETGMAHLLEHLLFKGTPTFPAIPRVLQERGAFFNATTWFDRTNYYETMAGTEANLDFGLKLEADRMVNSFVQKSDLDSEMTVVRNEFEAGENNPSSILEERVFSTAYLWHNYGQSTIGAKSDIENVPITRLQAFYKKYYQPNNAILVVAGKFEQTQALKLIQQYFGAIPKPDRKPEQTYTQEPAQDGERLVTLRRVGEIQVLGALYHIPQAAHPDLAGLLILDHILTNAPAGRLYKALIPTQKATRVNGTVYQLYDPGAYYLSIEIPKAKSLPEVQTVFDQVIAQVVAKGVTPEEMQRAKVYFDKADTDTFSDSQALALELTEWAAMGDWRLFFVNRDRLQKVTPADVQRVARTYLTPINRTVGKYVPTKQSERVDIPSGVDVARVAEGYVPRAAIAQGEVFEATSENLSKRAQFSTLPGGLKLTLIPKKTRGETVNLQLAFFLGTPKQLVDKKYLNSYTAQMLNRGTTSLTRQQLKDRLDQLKAKVSINAGRANQTLVSLETIRANLPEVLALVGQMLRQPSFDPTEFAQIKLQTLANLESQKTDPQRLALDSVSQTLYKPDTIFNPGSIDDRIAALKKLEVKDLKSFHQQYYGASSGVIAVVGDFDEKTISPQLAQALGNWKAPVPAEFIAVNRQDLAPTKTGSDLIRIADKPNAIFVASQAVTVKETDPDYTALEAGIYIFGGGSLSSRFADRVRQKEGYSYGAGAGITVSAKADFGVFTTYAISNNVNAPKVEQAFREEVALLLDKGITSEELKRTQDALIQEDRVDLDSDTNLAATALGYQLRGQTFTEITAREQRIRNLTVESINAALRQYIKLDRIRVVKAGDFTQ